MLTGPMLNHQTIMVVQFLIYCILYNKIFSYWAFSGDYFHQTMRGSIRYQTIRTNTYQNMKQIGPETGLTSDLNDEEKTKSTNKTPP